MHRNIARFRILCDRKVLEEVKINCTMYIVAHKFSDYFRVKASPTNAWFFAANKRSLGL